MLAGTLAACRGLRLLEGVHLADLCLKFQSLWVTFYLLALSCGFLVAAWLVAWRSSPSLDLSLGRLVPALVEPDCASLRTIALLVKKKGFFFREPQKLQRARRKALRMIMHPHAPRQR